MQQHEGQDVAALIRLASDAAADVVVFPEMYSNGYADFDPADPAAEAEWRAGAQSPDGEFIGHFRAAARAHNLHVVATLLERGDPDPFNTALLVDPDGGIVLSHRKVHICHFDTPERACGPGKSIDVATIETGAGPVTVGIMICMDREFADVGAALSSQGAEIALVPNCCKLANDPAVGDVRLAQIRGRAFETVMGIAVANYPAPKCDGRSVAVDALGSLIARAGTEPETLLAEFDLAAIRRARDSDRFRWRRDGGGSL